MATRKKTKSNGLTLKGVFSLIGLGATLAVAGLIIVPTVIGLSKHIEVFYGLRPAPDAARESVQEQKLQWLYNALQEIHAEIHQGGGGSGGASFGGGTIALH